MHHPIFKLALALSVLPLGGCYVVAEPAAPTVVETYEPVYYEGHVVYFDTVGAPYVVVHGEVRHVPRSYAHYDVLVSHHRAHPRAYHAEHGRQEPARRGRSGHRSDRRGNRHGR